MDVHQVLYFIPLQFVPRVCAFFFASFLALKTLQIPSQPKRWAILPVLFVLISTTFSASDQLPLPLELGLLAGLAVRQFLVVWFANIFYLLIIKQYSVPSTSISPWLKAYKAFYSSRRPPSTAPPNHESNSRTSFARKQCFKIVFCIAITTGLSIVTDPLIIFLVQHLKYPKASLMEQTYFIRRLHEVNTLEVLLRSLTTIEFVLGTWAMCTFFHTIFSLFFVCILRIDEPEEWPVLFGSFKETYSVRAFWGKFWHRLVSSIWLSLAIPIVGKFFNNATTPSRHGMQRILVTGLVFLFSGLNHGFVGWSQGFTCGWWEEINIYIVNFMAIVVEDLVQREFENTGGRLPAWAGKIVGYCWTWGFMFWCVPKVQYTKSMCFPPEST